MFFTGVVCIIKKNMEIILLQSRQACLKFTEAWIKNRAKFKEHEWKIGNVLVPI